MKIFYCCLTLCCLMHLGCREKAEGMALALSDVMEAEYIERNFNGAVVVGNTKNIFFQENYGYSNRSLQEEIVAESSFDIASLNKSFIAALVLLAVEEEKLSLETPLVKLLKTYNYSGKFHEEITIHHLLTHTAGLGDYQHIDDNLSADNFRRFKAMHFDNASYVDFISNISSIHPPETAYYYSNFGYHLLCILLEDSYQLSFADLLQQKICIPYGLLHTYSPQSRTNMNVHTAEAYRFIDGEWLPNPYIDLSIGRRIYATAEDLYKWGRLLQKAGLLQEESLESMFTNHLEGMSKDYSYGYGWAIHAMGDNLAPGNLGIQASYKIHGGQTDGFKSILILLENGYLISVLSNSGNQTDLMRLSKKIVKKIIEHEKNDAFAL